MTILVYTVYMNICLENHTLQEFKQLHNLHPFWGFRLYVSPISAYISNISSIEMTLKQWFTTMRPQLSCC